MLERFARIARPLHRFRAAIWGLLAVALVAFVVALFGTVESQVLLASIVTLIWALLLLAFGQCFSGPIPVAAPGAGWLERARVLVVRAFLWLLAIAAVAAFGLVVLLTFRAAGLLLDGG